MKASSLLVEWRRKKGFNQVQAAEALGLSQTVISSYERGHTMPRADCALRIAKVTGGHVPFEAWGSDIATGNP